MRSRYWGGLALALSLGIYGCSLTAADSPAKPAAADVVPTKQNAADKSA